jgi:hypothetical protein
MPEHTKKYTEIIAESMFNKSMDMYLMGCNHSAGMLLDCSNAIMRTIYPAW